MELKTFKKGGIHPEENKLSVSAPIESLAPPAIVSIPISQHIGAPSKPLVKKGDEVKVGTPIAEMSSFISAFIHSSVSGTVSKIDDVVDSSGLRKQAIIIKTDGDTWEKSIDRSPELKKNFTLDASEIIEKVKKAGIVGLGGATFPSYVKLMVPKGKKAFAVVINGVECEPYLTSDHRIMLEKTDEILVGVSLIMKATNLKKAIIGIENNKPDAISIMRTKAKNFEGIEILPLKVMYPQGAEKQLIQAVTGKEVPAGGLPIDVGAVIFNVGTAFAIYEAVQKKKPLVERVVTVTGKAIPKPSNLLCRIGTPVANLLEQAGGSLENAGKIINGGPMMGKALVTPDVPITKGTSGILVMPKELATRKKESPCIRCAKCVTVCPMVLEPYLLSRLGRKYLWERFEVEKGMNCFECGSCSFTCPANIPLLDYIRVGKTEVGRIIRSRK
ncbi:MAG: electron transport complex subunit RsxC [Bacteriovoracaceae bacterium]|nr:electron transport complex subunit RsxC [Bacteriovoracaceae bacterium]